MEHVRPPLLLDCRPLYPEVVAFGAPRGTRTRLRTAAHQAGVTVSELIRRALAQAAAEPNGGPPTCFSGPGMSA